MADGDGGLMYGIPCTCSGQVLQRASTSDLMERSYDSLVAPAPTRDRRPGNVSARELSSGEKILDGVMVTAREVTSRDKMGRRGVSKVNGQRWPEQI